MRTLKPLFVSQHWAPLRCVQPRYCSKLANATVTSRQKRTTVSESFKSRVASGPRFQDFVKGLSESRSSAVDEGHSDKHGYLPEHLEMGNSRRGWSTWLKAVCSWMWWLGSALVLFVSVYFETYGCQMNVNDTEIAWSILQKKGYQRTVNLNEVPVFVFLMF